MCNATLWCDIYIAYKKCLVPKPQLGNENGPEAPASVMRCQSWGFDKYSSVPKVGLGNRIQNNLKGYRL